MTLILTVANASGVYQSSDYQLIDQRTGKPISDRAGSKQLDASFKLFTAVYPGVAHSPACRNQPRMSWGVTRHSASPTAS